MAVDCSFYKHSNFNGASESFTLTNSWRYWWIKFGSTLRNEITSFRATASNGRHGHAYGFTNRDFKGDYAALNMRNGWTCWWSNVGGALNDDIESALLINRNTDEFVLELGDLIIGPFRDQIDDALAGEDASRRGDPRIYANFWPSHDPSRKFVSIEQDLRVDVPWWPDYDARMRYDVYVYRHSPTEVRAYVAWISTWVEGGVFSGKILDQLHPQIVAGAPLVNAELASQLPLLSLIAAFRGPIQSVYLLPGREPNLPPPSSNFGHTGVHSENCCLVLTF
jgi:hypothetical protein